MRERTGIHGPYNVHVVKTEHGNVSVSGAVVSALFADACIETGALVRLVFLGMKMSGAGHTYRDYELFIAVPARTNNP